MTTGGGSDVRGEGSRIRGGGSQIGGGELRSPGIPPNLTPAYNIARYKP